jgi:hypothetical protein
MAPKSIKTPNREVAAGRTPDLRRGKTVTTGRDGKREIKRSETAPASRWADGAPGMAAAIIEASLLAAARRGNCASLAASSQGSTPSRASTESTLIGVPSLFLSIRSNKKLSNSGVRLETEAEFVILVTGFRTLGQARGSAERHGKYDVPRLPALGSETTQGAEFKKGALPRLLLPPVPRQTRAVQRPGSGSVTLIARSGAKPAHLSMQLFAVSMFYNLAT